MPSPAPNALLPVEHHSSPNWLAALRAGDGVALAECYRQHAPALLALAYRLTANRQDAEDVVHDVFVGLPQALRHYEDRGQFSAWLKRIAARTALMQQRRSRGRRETPRGMDVIPTQNDADVDAQRECTKSRIVRALQQLSPALRTVFVLKMIEDRTHADVAEVLGISVGTSEVRLSRAVAQLRAVLGDRS